jgi:acetyl esterase/lipase
MAYDMDSTKEHRARSVRKGGFILAAAIILCALSAGTVLPPVTYPMLVLAVGAPEVAPWLIGFGIVIIAVAWLRDGRGSLSVPAMLFASAAVSLAAVPLIRFPATARRFDQAMRAGLGANYLVTIPAVMRQGLRRHPLAPIELLTGLRAGPSRVIRGIPVTVSDGVRLTMDVYRPPASGSYPAVVQIYGGAWQRGTPGDNGTFASYLASRGYVVFAIDYRHAPQWRWPAQLTDVRTALRWIAAHGRQYDADVRRLALIGRSAGAELAMVAAYAPGAPPVQAVVSYYGPVDLEDGYRFPPRPDPLDVRAITEAFLGGSPDAAPERYREASPVTYAERPQPPTLLVYGSRDHVVEARYGALLSGRLRAGGTTSVFLEIPWAEHAFDMVSGGLGAQLALYHTERFLAWALTATNRESRPP